MEVYLVSTMSKPRKPVLRTNLTTGVVVEYPYFKLALEALNVTKHQDGFAKQYVRTGKIYEFKGEKYVVKYLRDKDQE